MVGLFLILGRYALYLKIKHNLFLMSGKRVLQIVQGPKTDLTCMWKRVINCLDTSNSKMLYGLIFIPLGDALHLCPSICEGINKVYH